MNSHPKYSFIIPSYNCAEFLHRSLNSILEQEFHDFEIIIIDDGSTDNTFEICTEYQHRDDRIKFYRQSNAGVSAARNNGISKSTGDYLFFIDADDSLYNSKVLSGIDNFIVHHADCDIFQFQIFFVNGEKISPIKSIHIDAAVDIVEYAKLKMACGSVCSYIFKRDVIVVNSIFFIAGLRISEDQAFVYSYFSYCKKIGVLSVPGYLYYSDNLNSTTKKAYSKKDLEGHIVATNAIIAHLHRNKSSYRFICERVAMMYMYILNICAQLKSDDFKYIKKNIHINPQFLRNNKGLLLIAMKINFHLTLLLYKRFILKR